MITTLAHAYAVEIQPASESVAPRLPRMSGSATLVMLVSITSRMAPSDAASVMIHLSVPRSSRRAASGPSSRGSEP